MSFMQQEPNSWESWDSATVKQILQTKISVHVGDVFFKSEIKGTDLPSLTVEKLRNEMKLSLLEYTEVNKFLVEEGCWPKEIATKIFNDPIHGNMEIHPVCLAVIDTPQFQRLRNVKQLGNGYYVYPGAAHNRFEHSLGVCHLAGQFVRRLKENQPELLIDNNDVLCLELAGLCHDLGHGPFSHVFDGKFIPKARPGSTWTHEKASRDMFDYIVELHKLMGKSGTFTKYGLTEIDMEFIKELIVGLNKDKKGKCKGRDESKAFLYEIVANKRNSIDVDKWDYFARDCHQLGISNNFDHSRFIKFARVISVNGEVQICIRDKEIMNLYNMFSTRYSLHRIAYQHPVICALDIMVGEILVKADKHVLLTGKNGIKLKISECIDDMEAYTQLTDNILYAILYQTDPDEESSKQELKAAKGIIQQIFSRDLYTCIEESQPLNPSDLNEQTEETIKKAILEKYREITGDVTGDDFFVQIVNFDFGMKNENPLEKLSTYSKSDPDKARLLRPDEVSKILSPSFYKEHLVRIYIRNKHEEGKIQAIKRACLFDPLSTIFKKTKVDETTADRP